MHEVSVLLDRIEYKVRRCIENVTWQLIDMTWTQEYYQTKCIPICVQQAMDIFFLIEILIEQGIQFITFMICQLVMCHFDGFSNSDRQQKLLCDFYWSQSSLNPLNSHVIFRSSLETFPYDLNAKEFMI